MESTKFIYPVGLYQCVVTEQAVTYSKSGNAQLVIRFEVEGRPNSTDPDTPFRTFNDGSAIPTYNRTMYLTITDRTFDMVCDQLEKLGYTARLSAFAPGMPGHQSLMGVRFDGWCKHEQSPEGDARERWNVSTYSAKPLESAPPQEIAKLDRMFGQKLQQRRAQNGKPVAAGVSSRPAPPPQDTSDPSDDDVPL